MYLILGMDSVRELRRWHEPERLLEMCVVVAVSRPDTDDIAPSSFEQIFHGRRQQVPASQGAYAENQRHRRTQSRRQRTTYRRLRAGTLWSGTSETTVFMSERSIMCIANPHPVEVCRR